MSEDRTKTPADPNEPKAKKAPSGVVKQAYTVEEVAEGLGLSVAAVKRMVSKEEIGSITIGGSRRVTARQLDDYLRSREAAAGWTPQPRDHKEQYSVQVPTEVPIPADPT